jgi:hypothetical protein
LKQLKGEFGAAKQLWCALKRFRPRRVVFERRIAPILSISGPRSLPAPAPRYRRGLFGGIFPHFWRNFRRFGGIPLVKAHFPGKHDDQADSTAQFLDWYKRPGPNDGYLEWLRDGAEKKKEQEKPRPPKTNYAVGSVEWAREHGVALEDLDDF